MRREPTTPPNITERDFQRLVEDLASAHGWSHWHDNDSRRNRRGFPDLLLLRGPRLVVAELKVGRGVTKPEQRMWLRRFAAVGAYTAVWRPDAAPGAEKWDGRVDQLDDGCIERVLTAFPERSAGVKVRDLDIAKCGWEAATEIAEAEID